MGAKYLMFTDDVYEDMKSILNKQDTSEYPKVKCEMPPVNKKVLGKMKDENNAKIFNEFVGLEATNMEGKEKENC